MTATFLVAIDIGSDTDLVAIATEISDAVEQSGWSVQSVRPWQRQGLGVVGLSAAPPAPSAPIQLPPTL